jgi:hypothetical protein
LTLIIKRQATNTNTHLTKLIKWTE